MNFTRKQIEDAVKAKGYVWFTGTKDFDLNIVGVRNSSTGNSVTNVFDDVLTVSYKENGEEKFQSWTITTDPGKKAMLEYHNAAGVAILVPGQYRGSHMIGLHQGKYEALKQQKNVKVYRDSDKDMVYDKDKIQEGIFGINIHRANINESNTVENWSEGCQVFKKGADFDKFMEICRKARAIHGNSFTYTLIESKDIV
jgi:hypothetical protein